MIDPLLGDREAEDWQVYSPVLRAKTSEWKALAALTPAVRKRIAPIIEFVPEWRGPGSGNSTRKRRAPQTAAEYVGRMLDASIASTPTGTQSFAYFGHATPNAQWSGIDLWRAFASTIPESSRIIPLVDLPAVARAVGLADAVQKCGARIGLRIRAHDVGPELASGIADSLRLLGVSPQSAHIVVDLESSPGAASHARIRCDLGSVGSFASTVVLAGVFPFDLSQYPPGVQSETRTECAFSKA